MVYYKSIYRNQQFLILFVREATEKTSQHVFYVQLIAILILAKLTPTQMLVVKEANRVKDGHFFTCARPIFHNNYVRGFMLELKSSKRGLFELLFIQSHL